MASVATLLGITWDGVRPGPFTLLPHARKMAGVKGFSEDDILAAANTPEYTYPNGRFPGQVRHCKGGLCAVVDPERRVVITIYLNTVETALREDQTDADAVRFASAKSLAVGAV